MKQPSETDLSTRQIASQLFMHARTNGGEGNPFERMSIDWFVNLIEPKLAEIFLSLPYIDNIIYSEPPK